MKKAFLLLATGLFALAVLNPGAAGQDKPSGQAQIKVDRAEVKAVAGWLKAAAIPLKTVEAGNGFDDLAPLKSVLRDVRIVALGEATHGTREFFRFKHRMLEFLVREMGFTVFAIEASYPACLNINDYVLYGKGDRAAALASQKFWTWDTEEVADMIEWMRQYNLSAPQGRKVKFLGYDLQHLDQAMDLVLSYLKEVGPEFADKAARALDPLRLDPFKISEWPKAPQEEKDKTLGGLYGILGFLAFNETDFARRTSEEEFELVVQHARTLAQYYYAYSKPLWDEKDPGNTGGAWRDVFMARNAEYLLSREPAGTRMVLWAHNGHISKSTYGNGIKAMGGHLRDVFGEAYYALGFAFNQGAFQSRLMDETSDQNGALIEHRLGPAPRGSWNWFLAQAGIPASVIDLRAAPKEGPVAKWLWTGHLEISIGSGFSPKWSAENTLAPSVLPEEYDGLFFIESTTRARPNPTGERGPFKKTGAR